MDTPSPNPVDFTPVHENLLRAGVSILEGLCNLSAIGQERFWLSAAPLKIANCDAAPVRAYAIIEENT